MVKKRETETLNQFLSFKVDSLKRRVTNPEETGKDNGQARMRKEANVMKTKPDERGTVEED